MRERRDFGSTIESETQERFREKHDSWMQEKKKEILAFAASVSVAVPTGLALLMAQKIMFPEYDSIAPSITTAGITAAFVLDHFEEKFGVGDKSENTKTKSNKYGTAHI